MNCKPGELAIIVKGLDYGKEHVGKVVRVTVPNLVWPECWDYEGAYLVGSNGRVVICIEDEALRPIRDPGDDAVDETIQRLGKPANHKGKLVNAKPLKLEAL